MGGISDPKVGGKDVSQTLQPGVDEESDVSGGEAGDFMDVLIAKSLLEFEGDDFALAVCEAGEVGVELDQVFLIFRGFVRLESRADDFFPMDFVERLAAFFFAQDVESAVPADGEKPRFKAVLDLGEVLLAESDEGVLHHIASSVGVVEDGAGIADEGGFVIGERLLDEFFPGGRVGCFFSGVR